MNTLFRLSLWVSCLALAAALSSCGTGSPIPDTEDAQYVQDNSPNAEQLAGEGGVDEAADATKGKAASYLPGGYAWCYAFYSKVLSHKYYTYYWGNVTEPSGYVKIFSPAGKHSGVRYWFKKSPWYSPNSDISFSGTLKRLEFRGYGDTLQVHLWNNNTGQYDPWKTLAMSETFELYGVYPAILVKPWHIDANGRVVAEVRSMPGTINYIGSIYSTVN